MQLLLIYLGIQDCQQAFEIWRKKFLIIDALDILREDEVSNISEQIHWYQI